MATLVYSASTVHSGIGQPFLAFVCAQWDRPNFLFEIMCPLSFVKAASHHCRSLPAAYPTAYMHHPTMSSSPQRWTYLSSFELNTDPKIGERWKKWIIKFENLLIWMNIKDDTRKKAMMLHNGGQRALMLHNGGDEVNNIFETLADTREAKSTRKVKMQSQRTFNPKWLASLRCTNFDKLHSLLASPWTHSILIGIH